MSQLTIRVGAALDRSVDAVFNSTVAKARKAREAIGKESEAQSRAVVKAARMGGDAHEKEAARAVREQEKWQRKLDRIRDKENAAIVKEVADYEKAQDRKAKAAERAAARAAKAKEREERAAIASAARVAKAEEKASDKRWKSVGRVAGGVASVFGLPTTPVGLLGAGFGAVSGAVGSIAGGLGLDFGLAGAAKQSVALEAMATQISNAGYMPGAAGANGVRQNPASIIAQARSIGNATASDPTQVLEGLQAFVAKTGDLESARASLRDMAVLSKATGTNLADMIDASGDVANALGDTEDKGAKVVEVMRAIAAQGKLGAVEIKDLAVQMAKIAAQAPLFGGDRTRSIGVLGGLAQVARASGGASSSAQAANSVQSFANVFSKGQRLDAFDKYLGKGKLYNKNGLRDANDIIVESIAAASRYAKARGGGANIEQETMAKAMNEMFKDVNARRVTRGAQNAFMEAGGGEAGAAAAREYLEKFTKAAMNAGETAQSFAAAMSTTESKVQLLNNAYAEAAGRLSKAVEEGLMPLAPAVIKVVDYIAGRISDLTGDKETRKEKDAFAAEAQTTTVTSKLRNALASGGDVSNEDIAAAKKALQEQSDAIEARRAAYGDTTNAEASKERLSRMGDNGFGSYESSDETKAQLQADESYITRSTQSAQILAAAIAEAISRKEFQLKVKQDSESKALPPRTGQNAHAASTFRSK